MEVGGRGARVLRLLLLLVVLLAGLQYLLGTIWSPGPLRTYLASTNDYNYPYRSKFQRWPMKLYDQENQNKSKIYEKLFVTETSLDSNLIAAMNKTARSNTSANETCPKKPPGLQGQLKINITDITLADIANLYPEVGKGGRYAPKECVARYKVAIVVPFRDREQHLAIFLNHMHPFLMKQQLDYGIYIVEQAGESPFNRGKLMNVGYAEAQRLRPLGGWDCFIFHDIDLLPTDDRNLYSCPKQPRHMSAAVDKFDFRLPYMDIFGGVAAFTAKQFQDVNGFSNIYWGWGGEDDDLAMRVKKMNYHVSRYPMSIARYKSLHHEPQPPNPKRYKNLKDASKRLKKDGLSSLEYEILNVTFNPLYTYIVANIDERS